MNNNILYDNKDFDSTKKNIEKQLKVSDIQHYFPIIDNYIDDSNFDYEDNSNLILKSRFIIKELSENNTELYTQKQSHYIKTFYKSNIYDRFAKKEVEKDIFIKKNPIVDVLGYSMNHYSLTPKILPNITSCITSDYINNYNNEAYIDAFFTYLGSKLTETRRCPTFPLFYGTYNCLSNNLKFDITEDYDDIKYNKSFSNNINKKFNIESVAIDIDSDNEQGEELEIIENELDIDILDIDNTYQDTQDKLELLKSLEDLPSSFINNMDVMDIDELENFSELEEEDDDTFKYINVKDYPTQLIFMEKLDLTLDDLLDETKLSDREWSSILFQICFGLAVAQKNFHFVHNDLHSSNIMFSTTETTFLYFEIDNVFYKVPTYGKITKIIDFGRATFTHNKTLYFSSTFDENGDAEGQYDYPINNSLKDCKIKPNKSFDLSRLATTIIEHFKPNTKVFNLLKIWMTDKHNQFIINEEDDFDLYKKIAKDIKNAVPIKQLKHNLFKKFIVNKKDIKSQYSIFKY